LAHDSCDHDHQLDLLQLTLPTIMQLSPRPCAPRCTAVTSGGRDLGVTSGQRGP
jgi:hypothetical protein